MNKGALDRGRFESIEAYLLGSMTPEERSLFEQEIANDAALRAEVELQRENTLAIELGGVTRLLKEVGAEQGEQVHGTSGRSWAGYLKYAAAVAVLLIGAWWWSSRPSQNERLFVEYHVADPGLPVPMSATDDPVFYDAMVAYKLGDYDEARSKWSPLLQADPSNDSLRYFIASAALAGANASAAIPLFETLAMDPSSVYHDKSRWFLFLAYLKTGRLEQMDALSLYNDPIYGDRARAIKSELTR